MNSNLNPEAMVKRLAADLVTNKYWLFAGRHDHSVMEDLRMWPNSQGGIWQADLVASVNIYVEDIDLFIPKGTLYVIDKDKGVWIKYGEAD